MVNGSYPSPKKSASQRHHDAAPHQRIDFWLSGVVDRAIEEPSRGLREIQGKARLSLREMQDAGELENPNPGIQLAVVTLQEIIALRA